MIDTISSDKDSFPRAFDECREVLWKTKFENASVNNTVDYLGGKQAKNK